MQNELIFKLLIDVNYSKIKYEFILNKKGYTKN